MENRNVWKSSYKKRRSNLPRQFSHLVYEKNRSNRRDIIRSKSHSKSMSRSLSVIRETTRAEMVGRTPVLRSYLKFGTLVNYLRAAGRSRRLSWFRASVVPRRDNAAITSPRWREHPSAPREKDFSTRRGWRYIADNAAMYTICGRNSVL